MDNPKLLRCIREAMPHVYRQQGHGKHEQDRVDAEAWWAKWREVRQYCGRLDDLKQKERAIDVFGQPTQEKDTEMSKNIRVFFGHPSGADAKAIAQGCRKIREIIHAKGENAGKSLRVSVISGRDDFQIHCRGDWSAWAKSVVSREHAMTRVPYYDLFVVPSQYVGRATAQIVDLATRGGRPVFLLKEERLERISSVYPYDPDDWQGGFKCEPKESSTPQQEKEDE